MHFVEGVHFRVAVNECVDVGVVERASGTHGDTQVCSRGGAVQWVCSRAKMNV